MSKSPVTIFLHLDYRSDLCVLLAAQHNWLFRGGSVENVAMPVGRVSQRVSNLGCLATVLVLVRLTCAQSVPSESPVPILTGSAGYFTNVRAGENQLSPVLMPVLLVPVGDKWLIESRGEITADLERPQGGGSYGGEVEGSIDYLQLDYIANRYVTFSAGRFLTPFGIYNERLYPIWIRDLQVAPLIFPIGTGSSDGVMLRGGFSLNSSASLNYATYFSAASTVDQFQSDRTTGVRVGLFFPRPRVEIGGSWQKLLQEDRSQSAGFHFAWQPPPIPLNLRLEYARTDSGSGYWVEGAYRFSQVPVWSSVMRRTEFVGRMQQFFAGKGAPQANGEYSLPRSDVQQPDFGLNYYFKDGLKASASYGRWLGKRNYNVWSVGVAYRFAIPLPGIGSQ